MQRSGFITQVRHFDTHNDAREAVNTKFDTINTGLKNFVTEMKALGVWENTAIVTISDFGRKLGSNGRGTDHAWGGILAPCFIHMSDICQLSRMLNCLACLPTASTRMPTVFDMLQYACLLCLILKETTSWLAEDCAEAKCSASSRAACTPNITPKMSTTAA